MSDFEIYARLERLEGGQALRTATVEGYVREWPGVGQQLVLVAESLNPEADGRLVNTSVITSIDHEGEDRWGMQMVIFTTASGSKYCVTRRPPPLDL